MATRFFGHGMHFQEGGTPQDEVTSDWNSEKLANRIGAPNFSVVDPGILSRSGYVHPSHVETLVRGPHRVRTLIALLLLPDEWKQALERRRLDIDVHEFPFSRRRDVNTIDLREILRTIADPTNQPVHVFCKKGVDRTGIVAALYEATQLDRGLPRILLNYVLHHGANFSTVRDIRRYYHELRGNNEMR